jgi:hypothetical protein
MSTNNLSITKERVKEWRVCESGYRWFLENFPQGGEFAQVHKALQTDKRYDDSIWLADRVFAELDTPTRVRQTVKISGADSDEIAKLAEGGGDANAATTGGDANAATTGEGANAATTGNWANAATTGYRANAATTGEGAVAAGLGRNCKAKAEAGGAIVLVHRAIDGAIAHIRASKVGENGIKPGVWYSLNSVGEFQEHQDEACL